MSNNFERDYSESCTECEEELRLLLYATCERAYNAGVNSVDIYKTLRLTPATVNDSSISESTSHRRIGVNLARLKGILLKGLRHLLRRKLFIVLLVLAISAVPFYNLCIVVTGSFINLFPTLTERRCLLPLHSTLLEMVRPVANCSAICATDWPGTDDPVSYQSFTASASSSVVIEFQRKPSREDFLPVAYSSRPIIVRNVVVDTDPTYTMSSSFNLSSLKNIFETEPGGMQAVAEECQFLPFRSTFNSLDEVFEEMTESSCSETTCLSKSWYVGWSNCHPGVAAKLRKLFPRPEFLPEDSESSIIDWIFIGSPGNGAAMHIDFVKRPSWQLQVSGTKTWLLRPPPECEIECPDSISFTSHAGDIVFLETNSWYHETFIEGDEISISIGSEYD